MQTDAPSPFISGTFKQQSWDSTSLGWLKECGRKYYFSMILGYRARALEESVHLRWGQLYHSALETYDRLRAEGADHEEALRHVVKKVLVATWDNGKPWQPEHNTKTRPNLVRSVVWYLEHFRNDTASTIVLANGKPAVELSFKLPVSDELTLCGHLDRVVGFQGGQFVMDRKTTSSTLGSYYFDQYKPDNQMSLYTFAAHAVFHTPVRGVIIDAVQVAVGFSRFQRGITYRTQDELNEWLDETRAWVRSAHAMAEANYWPANDKSCHKFGGCVFRKVCSAAPQVRQIMLDSDFEVRPWNPLLVRV